MRNLLLLSALLLLACFTAHSEEMPKLENPMSVQYLKKNLRKSHPRLVLNSSIEKNLKSKIKSDPMVANTYRAIRMNADKIMEADLLTRIQTGRRILYVSREMLYRVNMLGMVYRIEKDPAVLERLNREIIAVCNFTDWNPSHFLDVGEMSLAVALAIDWAGDALPRSTVDLAIDALIEKGLNPSFIPEYSGFWINGGNNWNQVCHCGMIAAAIAVAERDPELASKTLKRALDGIPHALMAYLPDGVYPEGPMYWAYGTGFSVITVAMFESAFGTDFGHTAFPCFIESALFYALSVAPSGVYYNFADCADERSRYGDMELAWFAAKTGNRAYLTEDLLLMDPAKMEKLSRLYGLGMVWLSQFKEKPAAKLPTAWMGKGTNPIAIFSDGAYYLGCKGGHGTSPHGNMDAGSFVFELDGVRWSVDLGMQPYHELEKIGFNLWNGCQDCDRWKLLTKNNFAHSTLTVNDQLFQANGHAEIESFTDGEQPQVTFDMTPVYGDLMKSAKRTFLRDGASSLTITDKLETSERTEMATWQLITTADVEFSGKDVVLKQDGKTLKIENISHPSCSFSVVSLYPAPLAIDEQIEGLKRLELRIPAWTFQEGKGEIKIKLYQ